MSEFALGTIVGLVILGVVMLFIITIVIGRLRTIARYTPAMVTPVAGVGPAGTVVAAPASPAPVSTRISARAARWGRTALGILALVSALVAVLVVLWFVSSRPDIAAKLPAETATKTEPSTRLTVHPAKPPTTNVVVESGPSWSEKAGKWIAESRESIEKTFRDLGLDWWQWLLAILIIAAILWALYRLGSWTFSGGVGRVVQVALAVIAIAFLVTAPWGAWRRDVAEWWNTPSVSTYATSTPGARSGDCPGVVKIVKLDHHWKELNPEGRCRLIEEFAGQDVELKDIRGTYKAGGWYPKRHPTHARANSEVVYARYSLCPQSTSGRVRWDCSSM